MSQQIENQIVKMQFDNASFEKNAEQSMSTLEKLKKMLHFDKVNMTPLQQAFAETEATATKAGFHIQDIWTKMGSIIEDQIANKIVNAGKKVFNALTLEGVSDGFKEYELKMGSIQTIMAGTGESLATVNKYLEELNTYSDKTIYSFSDMTNNIGKFTNAGVKLKDAVAAIKGIANEAAVSGANANEASRAMYNFSQALSAGFVKLIDWKSIENANMATQEFKQTLIDVAQGVGTVKKVGDDWQTTTTNAQGKISDLFNATKGFNDSLNHQWMTTDVLNNALEIYATDIRDVSVNVEEYEKHLREDLKLSDEQVEKYEQLGIKAADAATEIKTFTMLIDTLKEAIGSGWAMSWQYLIGDFEQAKALWTDVGKTVGGVIDGMSEARNNFLKQGLRSGWEKTIAGGGLEDVIPDAEKFRGILVDLAREQGILNKDQYVNIYDTNTFLESLHKSRWMTGDLLKDAITEYRDVLKSMSESELAEAGFSDEDIARLDMFNTRLALTDGLADEFSDSMNELGGRENIIQGLANIFDTLRNTIGPIRQAFMDAFGVLDPAKLSDLTQRFREFTEHLIVSKDASNTLYTTFKIAFGGIKTVLDALITTVKGVTKLFLPLLNLFDAVFGLAGKVIAAITGSNGALEAADKFSKVGDKISDVYLWAMQKLADFIDKVANAIRRIPDATIFRKINSAVKAATKAVSDFWNAFVQMPIIQQMINDFNNAIASIEAKVTPMIDSVSAAFDALGKKVDSAISWQTLNNTIAFVYNKIKSFVILIKDFATRIQTFFINLKSGKSVVDSFKTSFGDIVQKVKDLKKNLLDFFDSIFSKGDDVKSKFNLEEIQQAIHEFVTNLTPDQVTMIAVATAFMLIAVNMVKLSGAMRDAVDAFTGIGLAFKNLINSYVKKQKSTILQIAEAIVIVAAAFWVLSEIPEAKLKRALVAMIALTACIGALAIVLTVAGTRMAKVESKQTLVEMAAALAIISGALMAATLSLKVLEYVNLKGVLPKILVLAGIMVGLVMLTKLMDKLDKFKKGSFTVLAVSGALFLAAAALERIGSIPADAIQDSIDAMYKIMLALAALTFASSKVGVFSAVGLIAIILTLNKILPAIENIVNYDYTSIKKGLAQNQEIVKQLGLIVGAMTIIGAIAGNRLKGAGIALLSIAGVFAALVGIAKLASKLKPNELAQGESFIIKMGFVIGLIEVASRKSKLGMFGGKDGGEGTKALTRVAITMGILLGIAKLASMMKVKELVQGELALLGLTGVVAAMIGVARLSKNSEGLIKSISGMLFTIAMILGEVAILSLIHVEDVLPMLGVTLAIMAGIALLAASLHNTVTVIDKHKQKGISSKSVAGIIAALIAVGILAGIVVALSKMPMKNTALAAGSIIGVILSVAALAKVIGSINGEFSENQTKTVLGMLLVTAAIAATIGALSAWMQQYNIKSDTLIDAAKAIALVLVGISPAIAALGLVGDKDYSGALAPILGAIGIIIAVGAAITGMSRFGAGGDAMVKSAIALAIGLIAVCAPIAVLGAVGQLCDDIDITSAVTSVLLALVSVIAIGKVLVDMSNMGNPDAMIKSAQALAIGLLALSVPIAVIGAVGQLCKTANPLTMGAAVIGALGAMYGIQYILTEFARNIDMQAIETLNAAIPVLSACMVGVSIMAIAIAAAGMIPGNIAAGGMAMIEAIGVFIAIIGAIVIFGAVLNEFESVRKGLETGLDYVVLIMQKIGEAIGALVGGIGIGIANAAITIADSLTKFSEHLIPFTENMSKVSAEAVTGCKNLAEAMLYLAGAEFLNMIKNIVSFGPMDFDFATLGAGLAAFCDSIKDIPEDAITKASACSVIAKRLAEMSDSIDAKGGLAKAIFGDKDLDAFATGIGKFGMGLKTFCTNVQGIPEDSIELAKKACEVASPMIELTKSLVASGGILQGLMGEQDLAAFGSKLKTFAEGLKEFVGILAKIEVEVPNYGDLINKCADATTPMVNLARGIENSGGILARIVGDNTLDAFGTTLVPFANGLRIFANRLSSMQKEVPNFVYLITASATAAQKLVELANGLENMGSIFAIFTGENTLDKFGSTLKGFGEGLAGYATTLSGVDLELIDRANTSITELVHLGALASGVTATAFSNLKLAIEDISTMPINSVAGEIAVGTPTLVENVNTMFNNLVTVVTERIEKDRFAYMNYGYEIVWGIRQGILRNLSLIYNGIATMVNSIMVYLDSAMAPSKFNSYGANVAIGLTKGIEDYTDGVVTAAENMAKAVNNKLPETLKEKSPSRLSYEFGMNYDLGLANGITDYTSVAVAATQNMSEQVAGSANAIISEISKVIDSDMDTQPTIRPVLDTSDIVSKAGNINKMFDRSDLQLAYGISGSMKNSRAQNAVLESTNGDPEKQSGAQINFTQNNYSPKALSPIEIYRQTKNQISMLKGATANA